MDHTNDIVAAYLHGMTISDISAQFNVSGDEVIHLLVGEAVRLDVSEDEKEELGVVCDKFKCSMCKKECKLSDISTQSWLALECGRACCKSCRHKKDITRKHGISHSEYDALISSQTSCAICGQVEDNRRLVVDHDHATGKVRGLLCNKCNTALGLFKDDPELLSRAIEYINPPIYTLS